MIEKLTTRVPGKIYVLMSKPPGPHTEFIEVENADGRSINVGRWVQISDKPGNMYALELDHGAEGEKELG